MPEEASESRRKRHPIQVVARRTGLSLDLLRAWEKRYGVVEPGRSRGGRRLYSDEDVERLRLLRRASEAGRRIGNISRLGTDELAALVEEDSREAVSGPRGREERRKLAAAVFLRSCLAAMERLDARELEATLRRAMVALSGAELVEGVVGPLLQQIGELWSHGRLNPANEHLASAIVVRILGDLIRLASPASGSRTLVVATPAGQRHEFGALFAAATAASAGWNVTYLGSDLPAEDIAAAVSSSGANALALSIVRLSDEVDLGEELRALRRKLSRDVPIFVGGAGAGGYAAVIEEIGARILVGLDEFRLAIADIA